MKSNDKGLAIIILTIMGSEMAKLALKRPFAPDVNSILFAIGNLLILYAFALLLEYYLSIKK